MPRINKTLTSLHDVLELNDIKTIDVKGFNRRCGINLLNVFNRVIDPRVVGRSIYPLGETLLLGFFSVLGGANNWTEMAAFGTSNIKWLRKFSAYENGTPSHDQLGYIFGKVDQDAFQSVIMGFLRGNIRQLRRCLNIPDAESGLYEHWAIDGKEERGTGRSYSVNADDKVKNFQTLHVWNATDDVCIYSSPISEKTNEIPVAQAFLRSQSSLNNVLVTFDALHTQKETLRIIIDKGGDYVAGLKGNQKGLLEDAEPYFDADSLERIRNANTNYFAEVEKAHSQVEKREYFSVLVDPDTERDKLWKGISSYICCVKTITPINPKILPTTETRYYVSSLADTKLCASAIRGHWFCEIGHWHLDHSFREDENTTMDKNAFQNLSLLFKMVLALMKLLKATPDYKGYSITTIRKMFGWNLQENSRKLLAVIDKKTMAKLVSGEMLSTNDKAMIDKVLKDAAKNPIS